MKLKINSYVFKISLVDKIKDDSYLGLCKKDDLEILIYSKQTKEKIYSTVKHELTHAYIYAYGFDQVKFNEEIICDFFETYGEKIITDSKKVVKCLMKQS